MLVPRTELVRYRAMRPCASLLSVPRPSVHHPACAVETSTAVRGGICSYVRTSALLRHVCSIRADERAFVFFVEKTPMIL